MKALSRKRKFEIVITLNDPSIVSNATLQEYVRQAMEGWSGGYYSGHPLFNNVSKVTAKFRKK